jgi:hypothetical protein
MSNPLTMSGGGQMIRCVRLWTGEDQNSYFEEGWLELETGPHADLLTGKFPATTVSFQETASGGALDWHTAPVRQLVIHVERHTGLPDP